MNILGIETSCDETGVAVYSTEHGLVAHALHSQVDLHAVYGGVVPEIASRDHLQRLLPLIRSVLDEAGIERPDAIAHTAGPGLVGAPMVGGGMANGLDFTRWVSINPDVTLQVEREPRDEWIGMEAVTAISADGVGHSRGSLYDRSGRVGHASSSLYVAPR